MRLSLSWIILLTEMNLICSVMLLYFNLIKFFQVNILSCKLFKGHTTFLPETVIQVLLCNLYIYLVIKVPEIKNKILQRGDRKPAFSFKLKECLKFTFTVLLKAPHCYTMSLTCMTSRCVFSD